MPDGRRVLVLGGGIAGLTAAVELAGMLDDGQFDAVELWEADDHLGGKIRSSPFSGVDGVDEGADAYLLRIRHAADLAARVGIDDVTHPAASTAAVWHDGLHDLPAGLVLGLPAELAPFARTSLLSWRGKLRAAIEPLLPRTDPDDSLGRLVRARFGDEVHERLVDALVGSIYAADTDRWSLASVPQLAGVAERNRSLLLGARAMRRSAPAAAGPVFGAPRAGMSALVDACANAARQSGAEILTRRRASELVADGRSGWRVDGHRFEAVVLALPAAAAAALIGEIAPDAADALATIETADVTMIRLAVDDWPSRFAGRSGYLVPKPDQRHVTAVSFASQKWEHWRAPAGEQILRVSLGRDGLSVDDLDDDGLLTAALADLELHLGVPVEPTETSITRWRGAFPQYRPHHAERIDRAEQALPTGLALAGASYHGIGIPTCVASGTRAAHRARESMPAVQGNLS